MKTENWLDSLEEFGQCLNIELWRWLADSLIAFIIRISNRVYSFCSYICSFDSRASPCILVEELLGDGLLVADLDVSAAAVARVEAERERAFREQSRC